MLKRILLMMLFGSLLLIPVFPVVQPASSSTQSPSEILLGAGTLWAANGGTRAAYVDFYDNYVANPNLYIGLEQLANYWFNKKNVELSVLEGDGFSVDALAAIPENLSQYNLLYLDSYFSCQPADEPAIRSFISNGGGVVIISGTICYLAWNSTTLDNQQDLTSVEPWFGAYQYVNTGGNAYVTVANPLGTSLNVGDALTPTSQGSSAPAITNMSSDSQVVATWEDGSTYAFTHEFGQGRVYWQADVFPLSTSPPPPPSQPSSASAFLISPSSETVSVNESFTITVNLTNAQNLFGWQVVLKYNGTDLNLTGLWVPEDNVFAGHEWILLGPITKFYLDAIDGSSSGTVGGALLDGDVVTNVDSGVLCSANFTVIGAGQSLIEVAVESNPLHVNQDIPMLLWYSLWQNTTDARLSLEQDAAGSSCTVFVDPLIGDINGDGKVDIRDINIAAKAYGIVPGNSNWNPNADINSDGKVDIRDIALIAKNYGQHHPFF